MTSETMKTRDGLTVYDLDPLSAELWAVAGPAGWDYKDIDPDNLPDGFRWIDDDEWASLAAGTTVGEWQLSSITAIQQSPETDLAPYTSEAEAAEWED